MIFKRVRLFNKEVEKVAKVTKKMKTNKKEICENCKHWGNANLFLSEFVGGAKKKEEKNSE